MRSNMQKHQEEHIQARQDGMENKRHDSDRHGQKGKEEGFEGGTYEEEIVAPEILISPLLLDVCVCVLCVCARARGASICESCDCTE